MGQLANVIIAIDNIADDLESNLEFGKHTTLKYARPQGVTAEQTPLLAVYVDPMRHELIATEATYELRAPIVVAWFLSADKSSETGGVDDDKIVRSLIELGDQVVLRLAELSRGIPNMDGLYATLKVTRISADNGGVWQLRHELEVMQ